MDARQVNQTTDLLDFVGGLRKAGAYHVGACPFCGGRDRFTVKHTSDGDRWHCRHCGDGKYHTAIDYVMRRDDCDFKTAYKTLTGESPAPTCATKPTATPQPAPTPLIELPSAEWQAKAWSIVDAAADRLLLPEGERAREYLERRRSLRRSTWETWLLGFAWVNDPKANRKRPAIVIPHFEMSPFNGTESDVIYAVKYRFIDDDPDGLRFISLAGSKPLLYGLNQVLESDATLLLAEGEMNALSIWQCQPRGVSVLSFGSEGGLKPEVFRAIAKRYRRAFVWCDDEKRTKAYQAVLPCEGLQSPTIDGEEMDANRLLQTSQLADVLTAIIGVPCLEIGSNSK